MRSPLAMAFSAAVKTERATSQYTTADPAVQNTGQRFHKRMLVKLPPAELRRSTSSITDITSPMTTAARHPTGEVAQKRPNPPAYPAATPAPRATPRPAGAAAPRRSPPPTQPPRPAARHTITPPAPAAITAARTGMAGSAAVAMAATSPAPSHTASTYGQVERRTPR